MIKIPKKSTHLAPQDAQTKSRHSAQIKPKEYSRLNKSSGPATRMLSNIVSNTRRSNQKAGAGRQTAANAKVEKDLSKCDSSDSIQKRGEDLESRIRSALLRNGTRRITDPTSDSKSSKSVKFDPAVIFCKDPDTGGSDSKQERQFQTDVEAILKCKGSERERLRLLLDTLTKYDPQNRNQSTLNPRASIFQSASSLKAFLPPKVAEDQRHASLPNAVPRRKLHPRAALDPGIFEPQASVQVEKIKFPANQEVKNSQLLDLSESSNQLCEPSANVCSPPLNTVIRKTCRRKVDVPFVPRIPSSGSIKFQRNHLIDPFDDNGPGRVAVAMSSVWSQAILDSFTQKYPMTGFVNPVMPVLIQSQKTADVQQRLEFIIMQKKEMAAILGHLL